MNYTHFVEKKKQAYGKERQSWKAGEIQKDKLRREIEKIERDEREIESEREQGSKTRERERESREFCILSTTVSFYNQYKT